MKIPFYQVDAFTDAPLAGNPAAVIVLDDWPEDALLQKIAIENNLSETAFIVAAGEGADHDYHLRWFTPAVEVDLCGHATLAAGCVIFERLGFAGDEVRFKAMAGPLAVARTGGRYRMDFPNWKPEPVWPPDDMVAAMGGKPDEILRGPRDFLFVYPDEAAVRALTPDFRALKPFGEFVLIATAPGDEEGVDFVSRCFGPGVGIDEDPVTGSAHSTSAPYWAERLEKDSLAARQISPRGGTLWCGIAGDRVLIAGHAVIVIEGVFEV